MAVSGNQRQRAIDFCDTFLDDPLESILERPTFTNPFTNEEQEIRICAFGLNMKDAIREAERKRITCIAALDKIDTYILEYQVAKLKGPELCTVPQIGNVIETRENIQAELDNL